MRRASLDHVTDIADLINDPAIRPTLGGEGELDPTALIADRRNVWLFDEDGGACFAWRGPGIYEGHSFFRVRGRKAIQLGRSILHAMFDLYDARVIWGATPIENKAARWFNRQLGFLSLGEIEMPESGLCELFSMECDRCP